MKITEKYIDMLIYQSGLNEKKLGSDADSVSAKILYIKHQILINQALQDEIVDLADIWDGKESSKYGEQLQSVLSKLGIKDIPEFYTKENMNRILAEIDEKRK